MNNTIKFGSLIIAAASSIVYIYFTWANPNTNELRIYALNIGQGDALYIRTPQGKDILIDGGPDRSLLAELGSVMPPFDHSIEIVMATHPDADHIAGLTQLSESYTVQTLITNGTHKDTGFSRSLDAWAEAKPNGMQVLQARRGWNYRIEDNLWIEFLHPDPARHHKEVNDDAIVCIVHYNDFSALFTGDISQEVEAELLAAIPPERLDIDLLKVGHHGSKTSSSTDFLNATTPHIALISVGKDNRYGHPTYAALHRLQQVNADIFRTDQQGRIVCITTGKAATCQPD